MFKWDIHPLIVVKSGFSYVHRSTADFWPKKPEVYALLGPLHHPIDPLGLRLHADVCSQERGLLSDAGDDLFDVDIAVRGC